MESHQSLLMAVGSNNIILAPFVVLGLQVLAVFSLTENTATFSCQISGPGGKIFEISSKIGAVAIFLASFLASFVQFL